MTICLTVVVVVSAAIFARQSWQMDDSFTGYSAEPRLAFAAAYGNVDNVNRFIDEGDLVDERDWVGQTPLHLAAKFGRTAAVRALLERGADPKVVNSDYHETPLHNIAKTGVVEIFDLLISHGADVNARADTGDYSGGTPLHFATLLSNSYQAVEFLLDSGAKVNERNLRMETPLHQAVGNENLMIMKLLISRGADLSAEDDAGNTPLHAAVSVSQPHLLVTKFLLDKGADVTAKNKLKRTPLLVAAKFGQIAVMRLLIEYGSNMMTRDASGQNIIDIVYGSLLLSPETKEAVVQFVRDRGTIYPPHAENFLLHQAAGLGNANLITSILSSNESPTKYIAEMRDTFNRTALHHAVHFQRMEAARLLLDYGADVNARTVDNWTPLHVAAKTGNRDMIQLLIERGASIEATQNHDATALTVAAEYANAFLSASQRLLESGAKAAAKSNSTDSAIHKAILNQNIRLAALLIKSGADVNARGPDKLTPLAALMMSECCYPQIPIIGFLVDNGADISKGDAQRRTPLQLAILARKRKEPIEYLLYRGADPNAVDAAFCNAPLYLAVKVALYGSNYSVYNLPPSGTADIIRVLIRYGADPNNVDACTGKSPLQLLEYSIVPQKDPSLAVTVRRALLGRPPLTESTTPHPSALTTTGPSVMAKRASTPITTKQSPAQKQEP